jgi:hypothetical protein
MTNHLDRAIALLVSATDSLSEFTTPTADVATKPSVREAVDNSVKQIQRALAELSAAINPPSLDNIPVEFLTKADRLGVPLDDIEVRVVITTHHLSQFIGILNEIEQRFAEIRRVREYLLVRLPDMPIEQLGSRLPVYTATDFEWSEPKLSAAELAAIRANYRIDRALKQPPRGDDLFAQIEVAKLAWEQAQQQTQSERSMPTESDLDDLPF